MLNHRELALGSHSRSGDQWDGWESVYSPVGADGYPKPIWVWKTALPTKYPSSGSVVNVVRDAEGLFATCDGELHALHPKSGALLVEGCAERTLGIVH